MPDRVLLLSDKGMSFNGRVSLVGIAHSFMRLVHLAVVLLKVLHIAKVVLKPGYIIHEATVGEAGRRLIQTTWSGHAILRCQSVLVGLDFGLQSDRLRWRHSVHAFPLA